jgi:glycerol dehydrogenase-like iron-containing ADH family enzyme
MRDIVKEMMFASTVKELGLTRDELKEIVKHVAKAMTEEGSLTSMDVAMELRMNHKEWVEHKKELKDILLTIVLIINGNTELTIKQAGNII